MRNTMSRQAARRMRRGLGAVLLAVGLVGLSLPSWAGSCGELRSYNGIVAQASGSSVSVERGGRSTSFRKASDTRVVDEADAGVSGWGGLRAGLRVKVCWAFDDSPRAARIVFVTGG